MTKHYDDSELERPEINYTFDEKGRKERLNSDQYSAVIHYLLCVNHQLNEWARLPRLKDRFEALQNEALEVFNSLSPEDSLRATLKLVNGGIELLII